MTPRLHLALAVAGLGLAALKVSAGCSALTDLGDLSGGGADASDVSQPKEGGDASEETGGDADAAPSYANMTSAAAWSSFHTDTVSSGAAGFAGAAFDGRYLYLVPNNDGAPDGVVARYDTTATFAAGSSWSTFDATTVNAKASGFQGGVFDGRYVYFVPHANGYYSGIMARYDTTASFTAANSWSTFDTTTVNGGAEGFEGATFDGRYLYLVPQRNSTSYDGVVAQYDTTAAFGAAASWATFDTATVNAGATGFCGAAFDGRYVYVVPFNDGSYDGVVARYDTKASFITAASWSTFDVATVSANAKGFCTAAFDGRFLYLAPYDNGAYDGVVARYDTTASFNATSSWSVFDVAGVKAGAAGFFGTAFDGRYVYFVPNDNGTFDGIVARYDTTGAFASNASWSVFDTATVSSLAVGFGGAAFDGHYLYLVPTTNGIVMRFDDKTPPSMPSLPAFYGSFF